MEMHQVRYFLAVCETLNFTRASEKCNISQPALTKAIQRLEDILGDQLFDRSKAGISLTEFGQLMRPSLQELYQTACNAKAQALAASKKMQRLKVGIMCTIGLARLIDFISSFERRHPDIEISYEDGTLMQLNDRLDKGDIHLAISSTPYALPKRFAVTNLFKENFHIAFPAGHRFEKLDRIPMREMHKEHYVSRMNCEYSDLLVEMMEQQNVRVTTKHETPREDWIQEMVLANMGVAYIPQCMPLYSDLLTREVCEPEVIRDITILTVAERAQTHEMDEFITAAINYDWQTQSKKQKRVA